MHIYHALVLQIPFENVFRHPKLTPKPLAEGQGIDTHTIHVLYIYLHLVDFYGKRMLQDIHTRKLIWIPKMML